MKGSIRSSSTTGFTTTSIDLEIGIVPVSPVIWLAIGDNPQVAAELATFLL
jgi:hypothetical protein